MSIGNPPEDERPFRDESQEARPSVGRALQQARIAAGLTVDDVSNATRVRIAIVHAIEADDYTPCGGDVYARGHIRTLARAVRLERRGPNWTAAMVAAIVVVIGFVGFTAFKGGDTSGDSKSQVAEGTPPTVGQSASPTPTKNKPAEPTGEPSDSAIAAAPQDKVTVQVSAANGRSWISAKDHNGRMLFDGLLKKGQSKTFQDNSKINLILGDAGAIELYVNGKKIEDTFQPGAVERLTYTKGDPVAG
ncbi:helix-turn-helix domain-containing protein [Streptomyces tricolor]|uniref:helix-turn-helix domain-containing protein n=1 Tax=Streptomyces tricolor TaxID=68277 RepID=UPI00142E8BBB|nr:RodZ domain-containing protein [Streptomyces tricolor]